MPKVEIRQASAADTVPWLRMRSGLWGDIPQEDLEGEIGEILSDSFRRCWVVETEGGRLVGFLESRVRGAGESGGAAGYIEGWFVLPEFRRQGFGRALIEESEAWFRHHHCSRIASGPKAVTTDAGRLAHRALGFRETELYFGFRKDVSRAAAK